MNKKIVVCLVFVLSTLFSSAQYFKVADINNLLKALVDKTVCQHKQQPFDEEGHYTSDIPAMGKAPIYVGDSTQHRACSFYIILTTSMKDFSKIKTELKSLIKNPALKYKMKVTSDYMMGMVAESDGLSIQLIRNESLERVELFVFKE